MNVSAYLFGGAALFESDCWGSDAMRQAGLCPDDLRPDPPASARVPIWEGEAAMLGEAFEWARGLGASTAVGIGCGAAIPAGKPAAALKEYYKGALLRINATYKAGGRSRAAAVWCGPTDTFQTHLRASPFLGPRLSSTPM